MDIVHHALIGGAGFIGALADDAPLAGAGFVAGSVFPDLDVMFMVFGKRAFLRNHQGITHSVFCAPVYALSITALFTLLPDIGWNWGMYLGALAGIWLHVTLDWFNTFRIALFAPFDKRRFSADAVFFVDSVALALTGLFYLQYVFWDFKQALWIYAALFTAYVLAKWWMRRRLEHALKPLFAIPSSLNPFEFYILEADGDSRFGYLFNALTGNKSREKRYPAVSAEHQRLAEQSGVFRDMKRVTRAFYITEVSETAAGTTIRASDIAVRNYGGRFGQTELRFDGSGKLTYEMANI